MSVFLTGASGFLGGRLAQVLSARGEEVSSSRAEGQTSAIFQLPIRIVRGDLSDPAFLRSAPRRQPHLSLRRVLNRLGKAGNLSSGECCRHAEPAAGRETSRPPRTFRSHQHLRCLWLSAHSLRRIPSPDRRWTSLQPAPSAWRRPRFGRRRRNSVCRLQFFVRQPSTVRAAKPSPSTLRRSCATGGWPISTPAKLPADLRM